MAILKHIYVHNSNYHDFITYVLFQHDSHARPIFEEYILRHIREQQEQAAPEKNAKKEQKPAPTPHRPVVEAVTIGRIIDLNDPKIKASYGLTQWAKIQNLKTMSYYVKGGFCRLIHMTAARLWQVESSYRKGGTSP